MFSLVSQARRSGFRRAALAAALVSVSFCASATLVSDRGSLGGDDLIDWVQLGLDGDPVTQPGLVTSAMSRSATVSNPSLNGELYRFDESGGTGSYSGNFLTGDALLTTFFDNGPIRVDFGVLVARVGAQIQRMVSGSFIGNLKAFGTSGNLLEAVTLDGESTDHADNTAIFLGMTRATADIARIEFSVDLAVSDPQVTDFALAINRLDFGLRGTGGGPSPIPEPGSLALVGLALAASLARRRRVVLLR